VKTLKFREVIKILKKNGFEEIKQEGSHAHYQGFVGGRKRLVIVQTNHLNDDLAQGTLKSIIDQSGLGKKPFMK